VEEARLAGHIEAASAATSSEEIWNGVGNPVHAGTRKLLSRYGISTEGKRARQINRADYYAYDYLIGMDARNLKDMLRILGGDPEHKVHLLLDYSENPRDIADPWYTGDFEATFRDVDEGCRAFLKYIING
jgi:protein-tyrosine phosphatase